MAKGKESKWLRRLNARIEAFESTKKQVSGTKYSNGFKKPGSQSK